MRQALLAAGIASLLAACSAEQAVEPPQPVALTAEAAGHYCQMTVLDHPGPKAQVHLAGLEHPLWFTQVRDALAYDRMPEEAAEVTVIYVNDMGAAESWDEPGMENWIDISAAHFVIDSSRRGGMGAPELVPFSSPESAQDFADRHGGSIITFKDISDEMVLAPIEIDDIPATDPAGHDGHGEAPS